MFSFTWFIRVGFGVAGTCTEWVWWVSRLMSGLVRGYTLLWVLGLLIDSIISTWSCSGDTPISVERWPRHYPSSLNWFCYLQSFVRDSLFTRRDFFTNNGIPMMLSAVNVAGSVCEDSVWPVCCHITWGVCCCRRWFKKGVWSCRGMPERCSGHFWAMVWCGKGRVFCCWRVFVSASCSHFECCWSRSGETFAPLCFYHTHSPYEFSYQKPWEG